MRLHWHGRAGGDILVSPHFFWERRIPALLRLDVRHAFHPMHVTSVLCLEILAERMRRRTFARVLDMGCGCGILALAAVRMGAARAFGVDRDGRALACARRNGVDNGLTSSIHWIQASTPALRGSFDCVLSNLPRPVLDALWCDLAHLLAVGGHWIVSGFHDLDLGDILALARDHGLRLERRLSRDLSLGVPPPSGSYTWVALELVKEKTP